MFIISDWKPAKNFEIISVPLYLMTYFSFLQFLYTDSSETFLSVKKREKVGLDTCYMNNNRWMFTYTLQCSVRYPLWYFRKKGDSHSTMRALATGRELLSCCVFNILSTKILKCLFFNVSKHIDNKKYKLILILKVQIKLSFYTFTRCNTLTT